MNYRNIGSTGLKVSELGLGCSSIGNSIFNYGEEKDFLALLNYAFDNGINFFDTADTYAFGNSEILIGKAFHSKRDKIIIASKVGFLPSSLSARTKGLIPFIGSARKLIIPFKKSLKKLSKINQDFSPLHIRQSIEKSLSRLRTDYIDIYQLHNPPVNLIEEGEVFNVLDDLKADGKIRFYGVSAASIDDAILCLRFPGISTLQVEFNLINQKAALKLFPFLEEKPTGIIIKIPLARGVLTVNSKVQTGTYHKIELSKQQKVNLNKLENDIDKNIFPEAAIRFILDHQKVSTVIAGTKSINHLKENLNVLSNPSLTKEELQKIFASFSLAFGSI